MDLPLAGIRVIDFTANMSGPVCTRTLGDMGADVVKIESPSGDVLRGVGHSRGGISAYFANLNRAKRSVVLDLTDPSTRPVVDQLVDGADVVVHNMRLKAAGRLGIDPETLCARRPRLIHMSITGYGAVGPFADRPVYDHQIQALSGMAAMQGRGGGASPDLVRHGLVDKLAGQAAAQAILGALLQRERTGRGQSLTISMLEAAIAFLWPDGMMDHTIVGTPEFDHPSTARTFRLTPTADGFVAIMLITRKQWTGFLAALAIDADPSIYSTVEGGARYAGEIMRTARQRMATMTSDDVITVMTEHDVPCSAVIDPADVADHPQVAALGLVEEIDHPAMGPIRQPRPVPHFGAHLGDLSPAPTLGQHTAEVLSELGAEAT